MIEAHGVNVVRKQRAILRDVSLAFVPGELVAVLGPNGAGKSTLLHVLAGLLTPSSGRVAYDDVDIAEIAPRALARRRALLTQDSDVAFDLDAIELVKLGRAPHDDADADCTRVAVEALVRAQASHLARRRVATLSGGERQRVQLARVLAQIATSRATPRALFLDEPTASQDLEHQHGILNEAARLVREGHLCVAVLHDINLALAHATRVVVVRDGGVSLDATNDTTLDARELSQALGLPLRTVGPSERFMTLKFA